MRRWLLTIVLGALLTGCCPVSRGAAVLGTAAAMRDGVLDTGWLCAHHRWVGRVPSHLIFRDCQES